LVAAGCVSAPSALPPVGSADGFGLDGRISVNYGSQNISGKLQWVHEQKRDEIDLASPLGTQVARLVRSDTGVTLTDSERQTHHAADAETLTEQRLGWRLPLGGLADWVRGRAGPGVPAQVRRDAQGRLESLLQADWRIEYAYDDTALTGARLPRRLVMRYLKAAEPLEIRMVIDQWSVP
jgi:outer membrane lipoprotein LolB